MDLASLRQQHVAWVIQQNPIAVTVQRTQRTESSGAFTETTSTHGPYTVRIFQQAGGIPNEVSTLAGTKQVDKGWGLLADYQADLQAGPNVKDEFDVSGLGHFVVIAVYPQKVQGQVVGYQVDLEKVS